MEFGPFDGGTVAMTRQRNNVSPRARPFGRADPCARARPNRLRVSGKRRTANRDWYGHERDSVRENWNCAPEDASPFPSAGPLIAKDVAPRIQRRWSRVVRCFPWVRKASAAATKA